MNRSSVVFGLIAAPLLGWVGGGAAFATYSIDRARSASDPVQVEPDYARVQVILDRGCTGCHAGADAAAGLRLDSWDNIIAGSRHGEAIIPFDSDNSLAIELLTKLNGGPHPAELGANSIVADDVLALRMWIDAGARNADGVAPYADATQLLYVANQNSAMVSIIDMEADVVVRTVDLQELGFPPDAKPHHVAVEPDGSHWYVSLIAANRVLKFNRANELVGQVEFERPGMLALHPTEDFLYVGRSMAAVNPPQRIGIISRSDMEIDEIDVFFPRPHSMALHPNGEYLYTSSLAVNQIAAIELASDELELSTLDGPPHVFVQFAISPDGNTMVAAAQLTAKLLVFDITNPMSPALEDIIDVNAAPWHPTYSPDGHFVYFGNLGDNTITVVDMAVRRPAGLITGNGVAEPHGSALSPDGSRLYVSNRNVRGAYTPRYDLGDNANSGTVVVINTETHAIEKVIEVEGYAAGVGTRTRN